MTIQFHNDTRTRFLAISMASVLLLSLFSTALYDSAYADTKTTKKEPVKKTVKKTVTKKEPVKKEPAKKTTAKKTVTKKETTKNSATKTGKESSKITVSITSGSSTNQQCGKQCYSPSSVTIKSGGTVTWTNNDSSVHTVTSGTIQSGVDGIFNSDIIMPGKSYTYTFTEGGSYEYFCLVHPWARGIISTN